MEKCDLTKVYEFTLAQKILDALNQEAQTAKANLSLEAHEARLVRDLAGIEPKTRKFYDVLKRSVEAAPANTALTVDASALLLEVAPNRNIREVLDEVTQDATRAAFEAASAILACGWRAHYFTLMGS